MEVWRGTFNDGGKPDAKATALAARFLALGQQLGVVDEAEQFVELIAEAAHVILRARYRGKRTGPVGNHVQPAHASRIKPQFGGHTVHDAFNRDKRLRLPEAPVGAHRAFVRRGTAQHVRIAGDVVGAGKQAGGDHSRADASEVQYRVPRVGDNLGLEPEHLPVAANRCPYPVNLLPGVHT